MYVPKPNQITDKETIAEFINLHGFATVVTSLDGIPFASHLPVLHDQDRGILLGHMARANEQWQHLLSGEEILCIFHGPHAYISPRWYASKMAVPTWNYAVVHVYGVPKIIEDPVELRKIVDKTTAKYEKRFSTPLETNMPEETIEGMLKAIVGFSIKIDRMEAKYKLGQNKSAEDQTSMLQALEEDSAQDSNALAAFIRKKKK